MKTNSINKSKSTNAKRWFVAVYAAAFAAFLAFSLFSGVVGNNLEASGLKTGDPIPAGTPETTDETDDPAVWGKRFPRHYEDFMKTSQQGETLYGGSRAEKAAPTAEDPRSVLSESKLIEDPRLKTMWDAMPFSVDFREERGHAYMLDDQTYTGRQKAAKQPGSCINCHASAYLTYKKLGEGDINKGFDLLNKMPFMEARKEVNHPVSCIDCHDQKSMKLRVTRPSFINGIAALKASQGVKDYDVNRDATRQEMRTYTCAQCHVEYYFKGEGKTLTYPW